MEILSLQMLIVDFFPSMINILYTQPYLFFRLGATQALYTSGPTLWIQVYKYHTDILKNRDTDCIAGYVKYYKYSVANQRKKTKMYLCCICSAETKERANRMFFLIIFLRNNIFSQIFINSSSYLYLCTTPFS